MGTTIRIARTIEGRFVEKQLNPTILGNCLYLNKRNLTDYSKGKYREAQYANYLLLQAFDPSDRDVIRQGGFSGLGIMVRVFSDENKQVKLAEDSCAFCAAESAYTITWGKSIKIALQRLFPISTALAIACGNKDLNKIEKGSCLYESMAVEPFTDPNGPGGFDIYPLKVVNREDLPLEIALLLRVAEDYSSDLYLNTSEQRESSNTHANALSHSTIWMGAEAFKGKNKAKQNCIYSLASDPDGSGKRSVYIGEAVVSGNRLKTFQIDDRHYIDHTKEEAIAHRFTRYRIDTLKEDAREYLHDAQDTAIGILWMLQQECPDGYRMTNIQLCSSISDAFQADSGERRVRSQTAAQSAD